MEVIAVMSTTTPQASGRVARVENDENGIREIEYDRRGLKEEDVMVIERTQLR